MGCARAEQSAPPHRIVSEMTAMTHSRTMRLASPASPPREWAATARGAPAQTHVSGGKGLFRMETTGTARRFG